MAFELREKAFRRHGQKLQAAKPRHVAEDVRAVEPLLVDGDAQLPDDLGRHLLEDPLRRFVFPQQFPVAVHRAVANVLVVPRKVERELHGGIETPRVGCLLHGPIAKLAQQQQPAHGVKFLGVPTDLRVERLPDFDCRHEFQNAGAEQTLHPVAQPAKSLGGELGVPPAELLGVEQAVLWERLRNHDVSHGCFVSI